MPPSPVGVSYRKKMIPPYGLNNFQWMMFRLDAALTGKPNQTVLNTIRNQEFKTALDWVLAHREWYLSDGGYSRLVADEEANIWVTSNSLERVKQNWALCDELIAEVRAEIKRAIDEATAA
jgi:hypothetical protein